MKIRSNFLILGIMLCLFLLFLCWGLCKELLSRRQATEAPQVAATETCFLSDGSCKQSVANAQIKPTPAPTAKPHHGSAATAKPRYSSASRPQKIAESPIFFNSTAQANKTPQSRATAHNSAASVAARNGVINTAEQKHNNTYTNTASTFPYKNSTATENHMSTGMQNRIENHIKPTSVKSAAPAVETAKMVPSVSEHSTNGFIIKYAATNQSRHKYAVACGFGGLFNAFWKAWLSKSENMAPATDISGTARAELTDNGIQYPAGTYYLCVKATQENNNCTGGDYFWGVHHTQIIGHDLNSAQTVEAQCFTDKPAAKNATQNCLRSDKSGEEGDAIRWSCKSYNFKAGRIYEIKMNTYGL